MPKEAVIWVTIGVYFAFMLVIGLISSRHTNSMGEFTVGGRNAGAWTSALSYGTAYFSAVMFIGYAGGTGWKYGLWGVLPGIGNAVFGSLLAWLVLARRTRSATRRMKIKSMPQFFDKRFVSSPMKLFATFVIFIFLRRNPYPLVYRCFKESGLTAFFTRSSAANIPVNMQLCEKLGLDKDMYSVSIPLGATINMNGAAITITIMAMAAANTLGIQISLPAAILLSVVSALGACGASGVAGGSLLLIPMACSLFGISNDIAMQVVGVGFIIGVIQDSVETCLNSASDVEFAATAEYHAWLKQGRQLPAFMYSKKERAKLGIEA